MRLGCVIYGGGGKRLKISVFEKKNFLLLQVSDFGTAQLETILKNVDHCGFPQNTEVSLS